jgi:hypothetical protein
MLKLQRRRLAIANNDKENQTRIYKVGDKVLIMQRKYEHKSKTKLSSPTKGPFIITRVYMNGNVCIHRGAYEEDISICGLRPYYDLE